MIEWDLEAIFYGEVQRLPINVKVDTTKGDEV